MKSLQIPTKELHFSFSKSSGTGGQNVNKVNTKVTMRWNTRLTCSFSKGLIERFQKKYHNRILADGTLVIQSQRYRVQARNIADCIEKLRGMLDAVAKPPKRRKATKPKRSAIEKRLTDKKKQSEKKRLRRY